MAQIATTRPPSSSSSKPTSAQFDAGQDLGLGHAIDAGALLDQAHERLVAPRLAVGLPDVALGDSVAHEHVRGGEHAAHQLDRGGREMNARRWADRRQRLQNLCGVPVAGRRVAAHDSGPLGMMRRLRELVAALARADLHFADERRVGAVEAGGVERPHRQVGGGGVAADAAHVGGRAQPLAVELGQAVDEAVEPRRRRVLLAVPLS